MSEIICSYTINNDASTSAYFITDSRATFYQFSEFITSNIFAEDFLIRDATTKQIICNTEQLNANFSSALQSGNALSIFWRKFNQNQNQNLSQKQRQNKLKKRKKKIYLVQSHKTFLLNSALKLKKTLILVK